MTKLAIGRRPAGRTQGVVVSLGKQLRDARAETAKTQAWLQEAREDLEVVRGALSAHGVR